MYILKKDKNKDQQGKGNVHKTQHRHDQVGHPEDTKPKPGVDIRAVKVIDP
jgi:hypothetical protein